MSTRTFITGFLVAFSLFAFSTDAFSDVTGKTYIIDGTQQVKLKIKKVMKETFEEPLANTLIFHEDGTFENVTLGIVGTWEYINKNTIMVTVAPEAFEGFVEYSLSLDGFDTTAAYRKSVFNMKIKEKKDGSIKSKFKGTADVVFHGLLDGADATGTFKLKLKYVGAPQL
jgi:hypothetical protein